MEEVKVYTVAEAAEMSTDYVYDRVQDGSLGCFRMGNKIRFSIEHLKSFLEKNEETAQDVKRN